MNAPNLRALAPDVLFCGILSVALCCNAALDTAENSFSVNLPPAAFPEAQLPGSPFGINTAFGPGGADLEQRLEAMQRAGIK